MDNGKLTYKKSPKDPVIKTIDLKEVLAIKPVPGLQKGAKKKFADCGIELVVVDRSIFLNATVSTSYEHKCSYVNS